MCSHRINSRQKVFSAVRFRSANPASTTHSMHPSLNIEKYKIETKVVAILPIKIDNFDAAFF
jgi:hypothetical protein